MSVEKYAMSDLSALQVLANSFFPSVPLHSHLQAIPRNSRFGCVKETTRGAQMRNIEKMWGCYSRTIHCVQFLL